jgi:hypothetical protein
MKSSLLVCDPPDRSEKRPKMLETKAEKEWRQALQGLASEAENAAEESRTAAATAVVLSRKACQLSGFLAQLIASGPEKS